MEVSPALRGRQLSVELEGRATIGGREIVRAALPADDRTQAFENRHLVVSEDLKVAVLGSAKAGGKRGAKVRIITDLPVRIPAGGKAKLQIAVPTKNIASKARLKLTKAPQGISIRKMASYGSKLNVQLESDAAKMKPGFKGKLVVTAYGPASSATTNKTAQVTLPPIPFEIIGE